MKKFIVVLVMLLLVNVVSFADTTSIQYVREYGIDVTSTSEYNFIVNIRDRAVFNDVTYIQVEKQPEYTIQTENLKTFSLPEFSVNTAVNTVNVNVIHRYLAVKQVPVIPEGLTYQRLTNFKEYTTYLQPTLYYDFNDPVVTILATQLGLSTTLAPADNINKIANYVIRETRYDTKELGLTQASQVIKDKAGVCSDYTAVTVALLRKMGIPARGVTGIRLEDATDTTGVSHMWTEINVDGKWYILETTITLSGNGTPVIDIPFLSKALESSIYLPLNIEAGQGESQAIKVNASGYGVTKLAFSKNTYKITHSTPTVVNTTVVEPTPEGNSTPVAMPTQLVTRFERIATGLQREANCTFPTTQSGLTTHWAFNHLQAVDTIFPVETSLRDLDMNRQITRGEVVSALDAYLDLSSIYSIKEGGGFKDSNAPSVNRVVQLGALTGYPDGTFRPDATISRAELFAVLSRVVAFSTLSETCTPKEFTDLQGHWSAQSIHNLSKVLTIAGFPDNTVRPDSKVTSGEFVTLLNRITEALSKK